MMMSAPLIVIAGPTAVGKSGLAVRLAEKIDGSIISADSMQVYRGMDIGTAKISKEDMRSIPHYLLDVADPADDFTVADYQPLAETAIREVLNEGRIPILVGGTGFYIQAVVYGIDFDTDEGTDTKLRKELSALEKLRGKGYLHQCLEAVDPVSARLIHPNNTRRIIRALEFYEHTGEPFSEHNRRESEKKARYRTAFYVLTDDRKKLYARIDRRAALMVKEGLVDEVRRLLADGVPYAAQSMNSLGYRETVKALRNSEAELDRKALISEIALHTRHYAKRQLTWFKREKGAIWFDIGDFTEGEILTKIRQDLSMRGITDGR